MTCWPDAAAIVREAFDIAIEGDGWLGILHRPDGDRPPVKVKISAVTALGQPYVAITGDVFARDELAMPLALAINHALPIGALELEDDRYLLRATLPLVGLDRVALRRVVFHVARQTAHMTARGARPIDLQAFSHWAD